MFSRVLIVDGYTDEPSGFGVPPYIDVYPRYIAGVFWSIDPSTKIRYVTVDNIRRDPAEFIREANSYDVVIVVAGAVVPGKYLGGTPISFREIESWMPLIDRPLKILVGAAAKWGLGNIGGTIAVPPRRLEPFFDYIVKGDPEAFLHELLIHGREAASPWAQLTDMDLLDEFAVKGAKIIEQHPNYGYNLVVEIETFRGCPRRVSGGCSFCVTHLYGKPRQRSIKGVVREIEALHDIGARHFRLGRQADILVYGSPELEYVEWPKPSPRNLEKLFYGIRSVAPLIKTLHIDNVNPGTIARYSRESREALKIIVKYHTPGDVAAMGIETVDDKVMKMNNLKVGYNEAVEAVKLVHELGSTRGYNGLPEILAGVNFVLGLIGETKKTYEDNKRFLEELYSRGLLVRRINVRSILVLPGTRMALYGTSYLDKNRKYAWSFKKYVMSISRKFLERLVPKDTIVKYLYVEKYSPELSATIARQAGSYPLVVEIPCRLEPPKVVNALVYSHTGRSVRGVPVPLDPNTVPYSILSKVLGHHALEVIGSRPFTSNIELYKRFPWAKGLLAIGGYKCW